MTKVLLSSILFAKLKGLVNIFIFLPHYFNVKVHFAHLFSPWKRMVAVRREKGFSWESCLNVLSTNLVSRAIGFFMRSFVLILFAITFLIALVLLVPIWIAAVFLTTPFIYLFNLLFPYETRKNQARKAFIKSHALDPKNIPSVTAWFETAWKEKEQAKNILALENLRQIPPLGRDWHFGFTPTLDDYSQDLTSPLTYKEILLDRETEIAKIEQAFSKSQNANVLLVGDEGVGKHTIVDGLAQKLYSGKTVPALLNYRMVELNMEKILSQRHGYEEKITLIEALLSEAASAKNIIVVISDFHKYVSNNLAGDFSSVWEKYASHLQIRLLGITTPFYYQQLLFRNDKLNNLLNKVVVEEPAPQKALDILLKKALLFEKHYRLIIPFEALTAVIERCQYYITHIPFPEKAINLLDDVCLKAKGKVTPELVDEVLSEKTKLPVGVLSSHLKDKLLNLEKLLSRRIFGQTEAVAEIAKAIRRSYIEERRKKPLVSLLFLGPTGVGKTETAKTLARIFFNNEKSLLRFDMSFYQNKEDLLDLLGSLDKDQPGLLANTIREKPHSVLLIDEIEKAHKDILNVFLTLLDEGYLVDGLGERVDCKNLMVIATSNAASKQILAWIKQGKSLKELETLVREQVVEQGIFTPEWLNRFDKLLVFAPLKIETAYEIGYKIAQDLTQRYLEQKNLQITATPEELENWIKAAYKIESGAREIERVIRENMADKASREILT